MSTWSITLPVPNVSQFDDPSRASPDPRDANDCGPASDAACEGYYLGATPKPDDVANAIFNGQKPSTTTALQLQTYLLVRLLDTVDYDPTNRVALLYRTWRALRSGHPCIILQRYSESVDLLHWRVVCGLSPTTVTLMDPFVGQRVTQGYGVYWSLFAAASPNERALIVVRKDW